MKSYTVVLAGKEYEILQDIDGKFIKPEWLKDLEAYGTDVKPAHEPICVARKPIEGTVANNVLKHGTGGLNIDGTRIAAEPELAKNWDRVQSANQGIASTGIKQIDLRDRVPTGRFPANLILSDDPEVEAVFPQTKAGVAVNRNRGDRIPSTINYANHNGQDVGFNDSGSASRFFYTAKASKSERNAGLEGLPEDVGVGNYMAEAKWINDPRHKDGGYLASPSKPQANHHPTVKPLSLTKYLATLIKPPTGGRLLVPFSGSGSEMIGALQAGWEYVEGVELTEEYIPIAEARIKYWLSLKEKEVKQLELV